MGEGEGEGEGEREVHWGARRGWEGGVEVVGGGGRWCEREPHLPSLLSRPHLTSFSHIKREPVQKCEAILLRSLRRYSLVVSRDTAATLVKGH